MPAIAHGGSRLLLPDDGRIWAFTRRFDDVELLVVANFSADEVVPDLDGWQEDTLLLGNLPSPGPVLHAWESRVILR